MNDHDASPDTVTTDGSNPDAIATRVPRLHRPAAMPCPTDRPPAITTPVDAGFGFGTCASDADCTAGTNGRCTVTQNHGSRACTYDACVMDSDCTGAVVCACRETSGSYGGANVCLPGNCHVDADCLGGSGYCSPSYGTSCGSYDGFRGYYCHTPQDSCIDDSDCVGTNGQAGYCAYTPEVAHWSCFFTICAG
jgi:hypothetical protein